MLDSLFNILLLSFRLLAIIDPVGAIPLLAPILSQADDRTLSRINKLVGIGVPALLLLFTLSGDLLLKFFSIGDVELKIAGGIVLLVVSIDILREGYPKTATINVEEYIFVPIVTPMLVGPGAITAVLVMRNMYPLWEVVVSVLIASAVTYLVIRFAQQILKRLGANMLRIIGRFMSLIVAAWAISLIIDGISVIIGKTG